MPKYDPDGPEYYIYRLGRVFYELNRYFGPPKPTDTANEVDEWGDLSTDEQRRLRRAHLHGYRDAVAGRPDRGCRIADGRPDKRFAQVRIARARLGGPAGRPGPAPGPLSMI